MYENIGRKIKILAKVICLIEAIAAVGAGVYTLIIAASLQNYTPLIIKGIALIIAGPILAWVLSFVLYGFGQLVENSDNIVIQTRYK